MAKAEPKSKGKATPPKKRQASQWLVGVFGGGPMSLDDLVTVQAGTAQAAAEAYIEVAAPDAGLTLRVWPLRAHGDPTDYKTTTVQVATAV